MTEEREHETDVADRTDPITAALTKTYQEAGARRAQVSAEMDQATARLDDMKVERERLSAVVYGLEKLLNKAANDPEPDAAEPAEPFPAGADLLVQIMYVLKTDDEGRTAKEI